MARRDLPRSSVAQGRRFRTYVAKGMSKRSILATDRRKRLSEKKLKLARRNAQGLLLFFCDVDSPKTINDSYGHREGDLAIVRAADALEQTFRNSDILARLGGDEFAVLAMEASTQSQEVILHRLEKSLNANQSRYEMSLSVGLARFDPKHPVSLGELMAQADRAMYEQKRSRLERS